MSLKLSVGSGIEAMVSNPTRPIRRVHFENPTHRPGPRNVHICEGGCRREGASCRRRGASLLRLLASAFME